MWNWQPQRRQQLARVASRVQSATVAAVVTVAAMVMVVMPAAAVAAAAELVVVGARSPRQQRQQLQLVVPLLPTAAAAQTLPQRSLPTPRWAVMTMLVTTWRKAARCAPALLLPLQRRLWWPP